ncbi:MAG: AAA family ATPase [Chloroflexi bacterium]|nr:AAA family ATPase [Chloroflexota bacterium]
MQEINIQNLRCLEDTGKIELKPITVLLGQNSSGKSTFLRFFPLLRQSAESTTKGPILWYGGLTDFGSFSAALNRYSMKQVIKFGFHFPY